MKKSILLTIFLISITYSYSQIGIGTENPKATLDIVGKPTITTEIDGVLYPRISRNNLINKTIYGTSQTGVLIYVSDLSGTINSQTANVTEVGYYYFDGLVWKQLANNNEIGDIKQGLQISDHSGWIKLDGRLKSSLTISQQAQATAIGIGVNLLDATNSFLVQNGTTIGTTTGSNTKTILQNQLPNITLNGTTNTDGAHRHSIRAEYGTEYVNNASPGQYNQLTNNPVFPFLNDYTQNDGSHSHAFTTSSINGNVTQQNIDITPRSLSVTTFIYLGN